MYYTRMSKCCCTPFIGGQISRITLVTILPPIAVSRCCLHLSDLLLAAGGRDARLGLVQPPRVGLVLLGHATGGHVVAGPLARHLLSDDRVDALLKHNVVLPAT